MASHDARNFSVRTNHSPLATKLMAPVISPPDNPTFAPGEWDAGVRPSLSIILADVHLFQRRTCPGQLDLGAQKHIVVLVSLDGATALLTAEAVNTTQELVKSPSSGTISTSATCSPKQEGDTWEHVYQSIDVAPISLGPNAPARAEAVVRILKAKPKSYTAATAASAMLTKVSRQLSKQAS